MSSLPATIQPPQLAKALAAHPEIRLLDVRTAGEFGRTRIDGSYNVPLHELHAWADQIAAFRAPVVVVCRSGHRAATAVQVLRKHGTRSVHLLDGGILAWRGEGLPVQARKLTVTELLRRAVGVAGFALAAASVRENPLVALMIAIVALRLVLGQSVLPCAVAGTCATAPVSTAAVVESMKLHGTTS